MTTGPATPPQTNHAEDRTEWPIQVLRAAPESYLLQEILKLAEVAIDTDGHPPFSDQTLIQLRSANAPLLILLSYVPAAPEVPAALAGVAVVLEHDGQPASGTLELVVHPTYRNQGVGQVLLKSLQSARGFEALKAWSHGSHAAAQQLADHFGFEAVRALWRLRLALDAGHQLPAASLPRNISLRSFVPGQDEAAWLAVNAAAFAHHPEQGETSLADLRSLMEEQWFDAAGFLLAVDETDQIMGFHWTKIHAAPAGHQAIGEVYVVGIAPAAQGNGLGKALTLAGIDYLQKKGLSSIMLYVDADNTAAVSLYQSLGFARWDADTMYSYPSATNSNNKLQ